MPAKRIFGSDSKSELLPFAISSDELISRLGSKDALQELILESNRDHLISGRAYNTAGYVLQLFEYRGRNTTVNELVASSEDPKLTDRSAMGFCVPLLFVGSFQLRDSHRSQETRALGPVPMP